MVYLFVDQDREPCKTAEPVEMPFGSLGCVVDRCNQYIWTPPGKYDWTTRARRRHVTFWV